MNIKELDTATLWQLLADMSEMEIMKNPNTGDRFMYWRTIYKQITSEIDRRMLLDQ